MPSTRRIFVLCFAAWCVGRGKADEPRVPAKEKSTTPPAVAEIPAAESFWIIPLRVILLQSDEFPAANCSLRDEDLERIVGKVNRVWGPAGIAFGLESIRRETAIVPERLKPVPAAAAKDAVIEQGSNGKEPQSAAATHKTAPQAVKPHEAALRDAGSSDLFRAMIPAADRKFAGFRAYYIHAFDVNGIYYGRREMMIQEMAELRTVPGGIDEPLPRVTAHELGHGLGLVHRQDRVNLLASGTTGTGLSAEEIAAARKAAEKIPGALKMNDLEKTIAAETDPQRQALLKRWQAEVAKLTN